MKNTKAIFLIILGAFIMATGFAYAGEAYNQLSNGPFGNSNAVEFTPVNVPAAGLNRALPTMTEVKPPEQKTVPPVTKAAEVKAEPAKPTFGESVKNFLGEHRKDILLTGIGAYLGYALIGTLAGALTGGLFFFAFFALAAM